MMNNVRVILLTAVLTLTASCQTRNGDTLNQSNFASLGPASCEYDDIEEWLHSIAVERFSQFGDYSTYNLKVKKTDPYWKAYLSRPISNEGLYKGGAPTALLDPKNCNVVDIYMTQ